MSALQTELPRALRVAARPNDRVDPWGDGDPTVLGLMRRVKERFDPSYPGILVGGI